MKKINNTDIATYTNRSINTVNGWSKKQPQLMELVKIGALCKKNNLNETDIKKLLELKDSFIQSDNKLLK